MRFGGGGDSFILYNRNKDLIYFVISHLLGGVIS